MAQGSAPVSTTVAAFDVLGAGAAAAAVAAQFDKVVVVARDLGYVTQDAGSASLTLTFSPEQQMGLALRRIAAAIAEFDRSSAPLRVRAMIHYGVVFRNESKEGQVTYLGSAIRSAQSALRRAPEQGGLKATRDFFAHASTLTGLPFSLKAISGAAAADGLSDIVFADSAAASLSGEDGLLSTDPALVEFVKRRLAADLGPFAATMVDRAVRPATLATQLVKVLGGDIDDAAARARFESDVSDYIKSRGKN